MAPAYPIITARLRLRPFEPADLDDMRAFESRADVHRYLYGEPYTEERSRAVLRRRTGQVDLTADGDDLILAIELAGTVIGYVLLGLRSTEHRQGEVGFVLHPDHHGRGYAGEAATAALDLAFGHFGLHRVVGRCDARNTASAAALARLGMRREAHLVHSEMVKGEWGDELVYAILDDEWAAARR